MYGRGKPKVNSNQINVRKGNRDRRVVVFDLGTGSSRVVTKTSGNGTGCAKILKAGSRQTLTIRYHYEFFNF